MNRLRLVVPAFFPVLVLLSLAACGSDSPTQPSNEQIQVQDLVVGSGAVATNGDTITVHYVGRFTDGTVFEDSYQLQRPFTFRLGAGQVIAGWDQGIPGMKVGGIRRLTIPPSLAYGSMGRGTIPPNSTLVFDVELMSIQGK